MSRRTRHRGARVPGLFGFADGQPTTEVDEVPDNPRLRPCSWCGAHPNEPCTTRLRGRRVTRTEYHPARTQPATQETP